MVARVLVVACPGKGAFVVDREFAALSRECQIEVLRALPRRTRRLRDLDFEVEEAFPDGDPVITRRPKFGDYWRAGDV